MGKLSQRLLEGLERRDSIGNPTKWLISAFGGGADTAAGIRVNEVVALRNATVWACVRIIAESIAQLPLPIYRRLPNGGRERATSHPLYDILDRKPNPRMTSFTWRETLLHHLLVWGNGFSYIDFDNADRVKSLYPLLPDRTRAQLDADGNLVFVTRIKNDPNSISSSDNQQLTLAANQVLYIPGLGFDGLKGYSPIAQMRENIGVGLALTEYAARFFGNGATPGMLLKTENNLTPEQRNYLATQFAEGHQGLPNAHRMTVLERGLTVEKIGIPPNDSQFLESRKFSQLEIAGIFRVPPHMVANMDAATYSNIEHQAIEFAQYTIAPWCRRIEQAINAQLFTGNEAREFYAEFMVDGLERGDKVSRYEGYSKAINSGWMTRNEVRLKENLNPAPNLDVFITPVNMQPAQLMVQSAPNPNTEPFDPADPFEGTSRQKLMETQRPIIREIADRVLRRERADISQESARRVLTLVWLQDFYAGHRAFVEKQILPVLESYARLMRNDIERELGRPVAPVPGDFIAGLAESFGRRHADESFAMLRDDQSGPALERTFGTSTRRAERIAARESVKAGNALASHLYKSADIDTMIVGTDDCDRRVVGKHPPLKDGCTCVVVASGRTATTPDQTVHTSVDLQPQLDAALALAQSMADRPINLTVDGQRATEYRYDKQGRLSETRWQDVTGQVFVTGYLYDKQGRLTETRPVST